MTANGKALAQVSSEEMQILDARLLALRPDLKDVPDHIRWATIVLARIHGLDPLLKEIIPIEVRGKWEPYITLKGARRVADVRGVKYFRVLSPLSDRWGEEFYGLTAKELRQAIGLQDADMVWVCGIYLDGARFPFVELGVVGPSFPYKGSAPKWMMASIRAERRALLAACCLPYDAGTNGAPVDAEAIDVQVTILPEEPPVEPDGHEPVESEPERSEADFLAEARNEADFFAAVCAKSRYFNHANHVGHTLAKLGLEWSPEQEPALWDVLADYARKRADEKAAADEIGKLL